MQVYKDANGRLLLKLGDIDIDYNPAFRLFLTSRNPNPHFLPEVRKMLPASSIGWHGEGCQHVRQRRSASESQ